MQKTESKGFQSQLIIFPLNFVDFLWFSMGSTLTLAYENAIYEMQNVNPSRPDPGQREKINFDFYFYISLWCLKRFYEGL